MDRRGRQYLSGQQRGQIWDDYEDELVFDEPNPASTYRAPEAPAQEVYPERQRSSYPVAGNKPQPSRQRQSYGVETGTPDSLVPADDWKGNERQDRQW